MILVVRRSALVMTGLIFILILLIAGVGSGEEQAAFGESLTRAIVIDPGHGNFDGGAESEKGTLEKHLNLAISLKLRDALAQKGYTVIMTREDDEGIHDSALEDTAKKKKSDMNVRREMMNESGADIFVSIHMNMFSDSSCAGPQVFYSKNREESQKLGEIIQRGLNELSTENRAAKEGESSIYLLKNAEIPAVLVECGFLSNPLEEAKLCTEQYQNRVAEVIAERIDEFYRSLEK